MEPEDHPELNRVDGAIRIVVASIACVGGGIVFVVEAEDPELWQIAAAALVIALGLALPSLTSRWFRYRGEKDPPDRE